MKKLLLSLSLIAAFFVYLFIKEPKQPAIALQNPPAGGNTGPAPSAPAAATTPAPQTAPATQPTPVQTQTPPSAPQKPQGQYKDGSYVGNVADAYYGNVQVKAIIKNGAVSDVQFLQYPNTHSYSLEVNSYAMPYLTQEAVQSQNANVDIISGATQTSEAFIQSLASALSQAKP